MWKTNILPEYWIVYLRDLLCISSLKRLNGFWTFETIDIKNGNVNLCYYINKLTKTLHSMTPLFLKIKMKKKRKENDFVLDKLWCQEIIWFFCEKIKYSWHFAKNYVDYRLWNESIFWEFCFLRIILLPLKNSKNCNILMWRFQCNQFDSFMKQN